MTHAEKIEPVSQFKRPLISDEQSENLRLKTREVSRLLGLSPSNIIPVAGPHGYGLDHLAHRMAQSLKTRLFQFL